MASTTESTDAEPQEGDSGQLPAYASSIAAFHRAFHPELMQVVGEVPLPAGGCVLDLACGDGFYAGLFAGRLSADGRLVALDINPAFLELTRQNEELRSAACKVEIVQGSVDELPLDSGPCDLVWCAQSLYSLPEPLQAVRKMASALRPGGLVAVLENDTLHQLLLPWPSELEIVLRAAEYVAFSEETEQPGKYYVGRRLPALFAAAGLEPVGFRTQCIDRQAPLDDDLKTFLQSYLENLGQRVRPHLKAPLSDQFAELIDPASSRYLLAQEFFTMSWINVLAWGRRPA